VLALATLALATGMLTVSGLSSGAYAAVQFQVSYSSTVRGVGVVAGGPFWCAMDLISEALTSCVIMPDLIDLGLLEQAVDTFYSFGTVDAPSNLANTRVWLYSSPDDTVVNTGVVQKLQQFYIYYKASVVAVFNHSSEHGMPTLNYGVPCGTLESPFLLNCNYDAAGAILQYLYSDALNPATNSWSESQIYSLPQQKYLSSSWSGFSLADLSLNNLAYVFVPTNCSWPPPTGCDVHVVLHGCEQSVNDINMTYVLHAGYNGWAEANNIVVLYPQIVANELLGNPDACIDWWGYTSDSYADQDGAQNSLFWNMAQALLG